MKATPKTIQGWVDLNGEKEAEIRLLRSDLKLVKKNEQRLVDMALRDMELIYELRDALVNIRTIALSGLPLSPNLYDGLIEKAYDEKR